ncbi:hypothetical protein GD627_13475 [Arthrobacter yangruifuii]|uniref:Tetratricopeptide repeat protein n=1 Tax=Arthrobacter yangruifuii TaxID=2606616 RepID=A0A5N6MGB9_9MICC|nr:hypothetical protein [Arthrobacter yangruifuii]KAD3515283.1 hypothetical protein GD627_13475 [Arthrobacter yangruifuii]
MENNAVFILNEYRMLQSLQKRDYSAAVSYSQSAAEAAREQGDSWGFSRMAFQTGQLQHDLGLIQDAVATCRELLQSDAVKEHPEFDTRTRALLARIFHNDGQMHEALAVAWEAVNLPQTELSAEARRSVQHTLVSALAEEGDLEHAWAEALILEEMHHGETRPHTLGITYWVVANVAFMSSRLGEGSKYQSLAAENLTKLDDVNLWAQFNKAMGHVRLVAGLTGPETLECVERAEVAFEVAGGNDIDLYEVTITRAWWELESGNAAEAERLLRPLTEELAGPYPFLQARVLLLLSRALSSLEHQEEALKDAQQSEGIFNKLGADVYASECREIIDSIGIGVS